MELGLSEQELVSAMNAAKASNCISFSYPCRNACCFCDFSQNGPLILRPPFLKNYPSREDLEKLVGGLDPSKDVQIDVCDNFEIPFIYDLIGLIHERQLKAGSKAKLRIISTFSCFDPAKIDSLKTIKDNLFIDLSLLTFDSAFKSTIMGGGWPEQKTETLKKMIAAGIPDNISIWYFGDLMRLEQDLQTLQGLLTKENSRRMNFGLNYPYSTRYSNPKAKALSEKALSTLDEAISVFLEFISRNSLSTNYFLPLTHLSGKDFFTESRIKEFSSRILTAISGLGAAGQPLGEVGFITSRLFFDYARQAFPNLNWVCATNDSYGGTITTVGLLTFSDITKAINSSRRFKAYVMSESLLRQSNAGKSDLQYETAAAFKQRLGAEIYFF